MKAIDQGTGKLVTILSRDTEIDGNCICSYVEGGKRTLISLNRELLILADDSVTTALEEQCQKDMKAARPSGRFIAAGADLLLSRRSGLTPRAADLSSLDLLAAGLSTTILGVSSYEVNPVLKAVARVPGHYSYNLVQDRTMECENPPLMVTPKSDARLLWVNLGVTTKAEDEVHKVLGWVAENYKGSHPPPAVLFLGVMNTLRPQ